ncbi:MAG: methyltransferase domain-containing protein, partial [Gaiellaceae bacterium MAG52_C11]|nr:methyltransferase domain-containing protein [Candidatus Gaiellasilicea maunaloa]
APTTHRSRSEEPSVDEFIEATEVTNVNLQGDQWSELFHPDTIYFDEQHLTPRSAATVRSSCSCTSSSSPRGHGCWTPRAAGAATRPGSPRADAGSSASTTIRSRSSASGRERIRHDADYVEGDLRELPFEDDRFDAVVNWRTSFGFFDEAGNRKQLEEFARVLRPGGRLAMDLHSRDDVIRRMPARGPLISFAERDDDFLIERTEIDAVAGRSRTERIVVRDGRVRRFCFSLATPSASVLGVWLRAAGFSQVEAYGPHGEPLRFDSRRLVMVAER